MLTVNVDKCKKVFDWVIVTTDTDEIANIAQEHGAAAIMRPQELCGDAPNIEVYRHAMNKMGQHEGFIAVQANSPTIDMNLIVLAKKIMEMGVPEVMTCHPNRTVYGSIWGMTRERLDEYEDFYHPNPEVLIVDSSVDIHNRDDYNRALIQ